jgi:RNA polymerase sigma factor (TIGR02999 family)
VTDGSDPLAPAAPEPLTAEALIALTYDELRRIARSLVAGAPEATRPTSLVHLAWVKLSRRRREFADERHFVRTAAKAMRQILIDQARGRETNRRRVGQLAQSLDDVTLPAPAFVASPERLLEINEVLDTLEPDDQLLAEMMWFLELSEREAADALGTTRDDVHYRWPKLKRHIAAVLSAKSVK